MRTLNAGTGVVIAGVVVAALAIGAVSLMNNMEPSTSSSSSSSNDLDERTCEIARDIAGDFSVTDSLEESRLRVADLYNGYGEAASPAIAAGIRQWVAGLTSGNYRAAAQGISRVSDACAAEGF
jgi:hypothetical protein